MTFLELTKIVQKYNIPEDVNLVSHSGWECDPTDCDSAFYSKECNELVFSQYKSYNIDLFISEQLNKYYKGTDWICVYNRDRYYEQK